MMKKQVGVWATIPPTPTTHETKFNQYE